MLDMELTLNLKVEIEIESAAIGGAGNPVAFLLMLLLKRTVVPVATETGTETGSVLTNVVPGADQMRTTTLMLMVHPS